MDVRRLQVLVELARRGTMRAVADATGYGTSAVSAQLAALEREVGATLLEPDGRRVRLTPAGRRLVVHAETVLAAVAAARADLATDAEPHGDLRVGGYTTALRRFVLPVAAQLAVSHPRVRLVVQEREPDEVHPMLADDQLDLGLVYDYSLVPRRQPEGARRLGSSPMILVVPSAAVEQTAITTPADLRVLRRWPWIGNSRGVDDDELARRLCAVAGFEPDVRHHADDLGLVVAMVAQGLGVALVPDNAPPGDGVRRLPITVTPIRRRTWGVTRPGRERWPATALLLDLLAERMED